MGLYVHFQSIFIHIYIFWHKYYYIILINLFKTLLVYTFVFTDFKNVWHIYIADHEFLINLLLFVITLSVGQIFIYQFLEKWGPLNLSIVTGIRKILSIGLSIILFNKGITFVKGCSLGFGIFVIVLEVIEKVFHVGSHPHDKDKAH